jgi:hypothetical protein
MKKCLWPGRIGLSRVLSGAGDDTESASADIPAAGGHVKCPVSLSRHSSQDASGAAMSASAATTGRIAAGLRAAIADSGEVTGSTIQSQADVASAPIGKSRGNGLGTAWEREAFSTRGSRAGPGAEPVQMPRTLDGVGRLNASIRDNTSPVAGDPVRAVQHALYRAAKADPGRRFHALYDKISRRDVLWRAWVAVRRNNGAPGTGKITLAQVEEYGVGRLLGELAAELKEGRYRPLPARRVYIPC